MNRRIAVIDAGTNTFHLLIAEVFENSFFTVFKDRQFVKLAENGISRINHIAFERGIDAFLKFNTYADAFGADNITAVGTAALRTASNAPDFIGEIEHLTGIRIDVIDGISEARLISTGVLEILPKEPQDLFIVDIGGGSVEFIFVQGGSFKWIESLPIGIGILKSEYISSDPINDEDRQSIVGFLKDNLQFIFDRLSNQEYRFVGASGTFETLVQMHFKSTAVPPFAKLPKQDVLEILRGVINSSLRDRLAMEFLNPNRVDLIVPASILVEVLLSNLHLNHVGVSSYAMKEGIVASMCK